MAEKRELRIALSGYHNGQTVIPFVTAYAFCGHRRTTVRLRWHDISDQSTGEAVTFVGRDTFECEDWLAKQGVHLDGQGIY